MNEKILNGKLLTWTDKIFEQINIIEGTKNTMETKHDFTQGNILKKLVLFMVPIFGALVLQAMYGAVDLMIVGWFGTTAGISAVSTGSNLINLVVFTVTGLSMQLPVQLYGIFQWKRKNALCHGTGTGADISGSNPDVIFYEYPAGCIPHEDWSGGTDSDCFWNYFVQYLFCGSGEKRKLYTGEITYEKVQR